MGLERMSIGDDLVIVTHWIIQSSLRSCYGLLDIIQPSPGIGNQHIRVRTDTPTNIMHRRGARPTHNLKIGAVTLCVDWRQVLIKQSDPLCRLVLIKQSDPLCRLVLFYRVTLCVGNRVTLCVVVSRSDIFFSSNGSISQCQ